MTLSDEQREQIRAAAVYGASIIVLGMVGGIGQSMLDLLESDRPKPGSPFTELQAALLQSTKLLPPSPISDDFRLMLEKLVIAEGEWLQTWVGGGNQRLATAELQDAQQVASMASERLARLLGLDIPMPG